jgi:hypothetical protein
VPQEPKRTRVTPHVIDERYTRAAWLRPTELHQSRWTHATRDAYLERAKGAPARLPAGADFASGMGAMLTHDEATPLVHRFAEPELVGGRGGYVGLRPNVRPTLRERPQSARGAADFCRPQLCQVRPGAGVDAGHVRDRTLWRMAGLELRDAAPAGALRRAGGVLRFDVLFEHQPIDQPRSIATAAKLLYYLEDDSVQINLPADPFDTGATPNEFGLRGGRVFLRRARVVDGEGALALDVGRDLALGKTVTIHGRAFALVDCDAFTREFLERLHGGEPAETAPRIAPPALDERERLRAIVAGGARPFGARTSHSGHRMLW